LGALFRRWDSTGTSAVALTVLEQHLTGKTSGFLQFRFLPFSVISRTRVTNTEGTGRTTRIEEQGMPLLPKRAQPNGGPANGAVHLLLLKS